MAIETFRPSPSVKPKGKTAFLEGSALVSRDAVDAEAAARQAAEQDQEHLIYRMLNIKLNRRRHTALKTLSATTGKSMQDMMVELIDELLARQKTKKR